MKVALIAVTISVTPIYQIATQTCLRLENGWECNQPIRFIPLKFCSVHKFLCMQLHQTTLFPVWGSGTETAFSPAAHTSCTQLAGLKIVLRLTYHFFFLSPSPTSSLPNVTPFPQFMWCHSLQFPWQSVCILLDILCPASTPYSLRSYPTWSEVELGNIPVFCSLISNLV